MLLRKRRWKTVFAALVLITLQNMCLWAQNNAKITGTVYDETQIPMVGVPITVKGSAEGTVTDINGNFEMTLSLSESTVLVCTYIGYNPKEVKLNGQNHLTITMTPAINTLDDVVVIGYGTQKRLSITGAVGTVSYKDLARTTATTTAATLAGKTPGITFRQTNGQPGQTMRMEIRNMGSPLFIIDGIMKDEGQFNNLDINDIENISILKDGSAAIYGVKAANGVVLVTTKRGSLNEKPTIKINAYYGIQNWTRFPKMSDAYNYSNAYAEASLTTTGENRTGLTHDNLAKYATGYYNPDTGEDYRSFDWYDFVVNKNAPQKYLNVSSQGGSEKLNYYFSISKIDQSANFYDFNFNRTNFQANMDAQISKQLKTGISMNGRLENRLSPSVGDNYNNDFWNLRWGLNRNKPTERPYANDNPDYLNATTNIINNQAYARRDIIGTGDDRWRVFQGNWNIEWTSPLKGLKAAFLYSYYAANLQIDRRKLETPFYHYDYMTQTYSETSGLTTKSLQKRQATIWENMYRFSLQYENKFGNHNLNAIVVAEATERFDRALTMYNGEISDNFQTLFPNSSDNSITEDYLNEYPSAGYIARINYNYVNRYLLELSGRYDGSFKFPENNRWGFFPSISAGWRISEENFFSDSSIAQWMTNLKLRLSYGQLGDDNISGYGNFDHLSTYNYGESAVISNNPFNQTNGKIVRGIYQGNLPVTNLTWIKTNLSNIGMDWGFLNNRLSLEVDGFYRKREGLAARKAGVTLPNETGFTMPIENLNTDMHMGVDGFIKWRDNAAGFQYYVAVNATFARKKDGESWGQSFANSWDEYRSSIQSRWAYINWGYQVIGRFRTQEEIDAYPVIMNLTNGSDGNIPVLPGDLIYKDVNRDGVIDGYDSRPIGYAEGGLPYLTYGLNSGIVWKQFDLAVDFVGATMQSFQQNYETKWPFQADGNTYEFMASDRWRHEDPLDPSSPWIEGYYPALRLQPTDAWHNYCNNSTYWFTNLRYLRLRNLELGYTVPKLLTTKVSIEQLRLYFSGTNLFSWDNISHLGLDPENNDTNGLGYPNNRVMTIGATVTF